MSDALLKTPLHALQQTFNPRFVPFAGYEMPIFFNSMLDEHVHTRSVGKASLFDVSHMEQCLIKGQGATESLEKIIPAPLSTMKQGRMRYSMLLNESGGVIDDIMITRLEDESYFIVLNAACFEKDKAFLLMSLPSSLNISFYTDRALLAVQGKGARDVVARLWGDRFLTMPFMSHQTFLYEGHDIFVNCCGYTGEDGFEFSVPAVISESFVRSLLSVDCVQWAGLGARDSLRLEAGLCLYGHELIERITPIEADLLWTIKARHTHNPNYNGAAILDDQIRSGTKKMRVGFVGMTRQPVREGAMLCDEAGQEIGIVTSGGFSPTLNQPIGMAYVKTSFLENETWDLKAVVRDKFVPCRLHPMPFVKHSYYSSK